MRLPSPGLLIILLSVISALSASRTRGQQVIPESPAIWREVTGVITDYSDPENPVHLFTRPHMPGLRTTADGRIGVIVEGGGKEGASPRFTLLMPEKMDQPFLLSHPGGPGSHEPDQANSYTMSSPGFKWLDGYSSAWQSRYQFTEGISSGGHTCLWDDAPPVANANGEDVYDFKVFTSVNTKINDERRTQFMVTPVRVVVSNPKTVDAAITSITKTGPTIAGPQFPFSAQCFEPMIVGDGRLLVARVGSSDFTWTDPDTGAAKGPQWCDVFYSYYSDGETADPTGWTNLIPISHAPHDSRINTKFGFAKAPFRDTEGNLIPPGKDSGGSYPWMDREAKNLFLETVQDRLHYNANGTWNNSRYEQGAVPEEPAIYEGEDGGKHQGVSFLGLWSHGKLVQIDNLINDMDYAIGLGDDPNGVGPQQRMVNLYEPYTDPHEMRNGWLRLGYGRSTKRMPLGENDNGNIIDSLENLFNYRSKFFPLTNRDVVWPMTVGKQTDELAFDDYLDPDAFIIAPMNGALTYLDGGNRYQHHSGWSNSSQSFSLPVKLQNAATAPPDRWVTPKHGLVLGNGRLEPAATGGVHGKGFYLDGNIGLEFTVEEQPNQDVSAKDWYVGLFVDCRHGEDGVERRLLTFPDGTSIRLNGRRQVLYADASGTIVDRITLPPVLTSEPPDYLLDDLLPDRGWAHLAFQIRRMGTEVDFHLNGLLYHRWRDGYVSLFQLPPGELTIGQPEGETLTGFTGWVDDFKVFAHAVDPETACNHAGGTLIGLTSSYSGKWKSRFADRYPDWAHQAIGEVLENYGEETYPQYANYYDTMADHGAHRENLPAGTAWLRKSVHFPEGPLFHDAPRPDSVTNRFCLSCHHQDGQGGLDLAALELDDLYLAKEDPRRQPMQPPKRIHGRIPAGLIDSTGLPASATDLGAGGKLIDEWMLPSYSGPATVESFTVVDAATGRDLMPLAEGATLDPALLGTTEVALRANLDSAQGSVTMRYDGSGPTPELFVPPYEIDVTLEPGSRSIRATPESGSASVVNFTVPGGPRIIANFRDDFQKGSPGPGWSYLWNSAGPVSDPLSYRNLAWTPHSRYSVKGLVFPDFSVPEYAYGSFHGTGGHPGRGTNQGAGADRFAIAAYTVKLAGHYRISDSFVKIGSGQSNGGQVAIYVETDPDGDGETDFVEVRNDFFNPGVEHAFDGHVGHLVPGDTIYVGIGPGQHDGNDSFALDFSIEFEPAEFEVVAGFRGDFQTGSPKPGWSYSWNGHGPVNDPANYQPLVWSPSSNRYTYDGGDYPALNGNYCAWGAFHGNGGHPARGVNQGAGVDRFVVAGYTVELAGHYRISGSHVKINSSLGGGGQVVLYLETDADSDGNTDFVKVHDSYIAGGVEQAFDAYLGTLAPGDTIHVGIGPDQHDGHDGFALDFNIELEE